MNEVSILLLEDSALDADLVRSRLDHAEVAARIHRVETREGFVQSLRDHPFDIIFADYSLPAFDGLAALRIAQEIKPDIPFILVSGALGEELAVEALKSGAVDYVLKQRLDRLVPSMHRALREATVRREREQTEAELIKAKEAAEAANRAKDQFLAVLSHELRTPLSPILTTVHVLEMEPNLSPEVREGIEVIKRNVELEARLIDDLLDLTRIAKGKLQLHMQPVNLHDVVRAALDICRSEVHAKRHHCISDLKAARTTVMADPARLQQVLWNVLKNAVKFTPTGGTLAVRTYDDGDEAIVEVTDTGIGISADALPRIFSAFEQADSIIGRQFGGLGLGLAIAGALAAKHQGQLTAHSDGINRGSTFRLRLPTLTAAQGAAAASDRSPLPQGKTRILLIEDHHDTARVMARLLHRMGHQVQVAGTIKTAQQMLDQHQFDLLISDIGLPDGNGFDLMADIRDRHRIPAIALSGFSMDQDLARAREVGFVEHLVKPVDTEKLKAAIQAVKTRLASSPMDDA